MGILRALHTAQVRIYLDHAATTPLLPEVLSAMLPYLTEHFGNPSSVHAEGQEARAAVEEARATLAQHLECAPTEIVFTSGATESTALALFGALRAGEHLVTAHTEHASVRACAEEWGTVSYVPVGHDGSIRTADVLGALRDTTRVVSLMLANNEVGSLTDIGEVGLALRRVNEERESRGVPRVLLHTDAVQGACTLDIRIPALRADMVTLSAHKMGGPKGVGLLYVRSGVRLCPRVFGGGQEMNLRSGTEHVAGIVGCAAAMTHARQNWQEEAARLTTLRDALIAEVLRAAPAARLTGHATARNPNHASFVVPGKNAEQLLIGMDMAGIAISSGSACASGTLSASPTLLAMGYSESDALSSLRITLGHATREADIAACVAALRSLCAR